MKRMVRASGDGRAKKGGAQSARRIDALRKRMKLKISRQEVRRAIAKGRS